MAPGHPQRHVVTVAVEDYFQTSAFDGLIPPSRWGRFEPRLERNTQRALALLDEHGVRGTFIALGWIAEELPELIGEIARRGHEVACGGYLPRPIETLSPEVLREDLQRSREALERAAGQEVIGHRIARGHLGAEHRWALDVLAEEGFAWDSSFAPAVGSLPREPWRRAVHPHRQGDQLLWEVPLSPWSLSGWHPGSAGGSPLRLGPQGLMKRRLRRRDAPGNDPFDLRFRVWELDPDLPRISAASRLARARVYRGLEGMPALLDGYLGEFPFCGIGDYLGLSRRDLSATEAGAPGPRLLRMRDPQPVAATRSPQAAPAQGDPVIPRGRPPVTIVVPFFNEEESLAYFDRTLALVIRELKIRYEPRFVLVDDGSSDATFEALGARFGHRPECKIIRHDKNRGVAAAILTGIRAADTEIVCSMDCDCTYDPRHLLLMIPLLTPGVDLVTASPYHPEGAVANVPEWRLLLSRTLSRLYSAALGDDIHTWTSCFRVYRRRSVADISLENEGFLGVAETLIKVLEAGGRVVESPATLESRLFGESKMKIAGTIADHLGLLARVAARSSGGRPAAPPPPPQR